MVTNLSPATAAALSARRSSLLDHRAAAARGPGADQPRAGHAQGAHAGRAGGRRRSPRSDPSRGAGRLLAGLAPWLELGGDGTTKDSHARRYADLAQQAITRAVDPASPDFINFTRDRQPLVDAAFLGAGAAPCAERVDARLDDTTKRQLVAALESTRAIVPGYNNWLLFTATVEAALEAARRRWDRLRVDYAIRQHEQWYKGDGAYGDGAEFHWDYYNSFVIHPMLIDVLEACADDNPAWNEPDAAASTSARAVRGDLGAPDRA